MHAGGGGKKAGRWCEIKIVPAMQSEKNNASRMMERMDVVITSVVEKDSAMVRPPHTASTQHTTLCLLTLGVLYSAPPLLFPRHNTSILKRHRIIVAISRCGSNGARAIARASLGGRRGGGRPSDMVRSNSPVGCNVVSSRVYYSTHLQNPRANDARSYWVLAE